MNLHALLNFQLFSIGATSVTVATLITAVTVVALTWLVSRIARRGISAALRARGLVHVGRLAVTARLVHYVVMIVGIGIAVQTLGVDLGALFAAGAFFAIGLGFAMQSIAQNFVSGIILLVEQSIKPGDIIEVDGRVVCVVRTGTRATVARTRDEEDLIIPNSSIVASTVKNYTLRDTTYRLRAVVGVAYHADLARVSEVLGKVADDLPWRSASPAPTVGLAAFGTSSVDFEIAVWLDDPWQARRLGFDLNERIWWAFREADIEIAFPQLDLHLDEEVVSALNPPRPRAIPAPTT